MRIKLLRPPFYSSFPTFVRLPYGMGVLTAILRKAGYYVEQDDLAAKCNYHNKKVGIFSNKKIDLNILTYTHNMKSCLEKGISQKIFNQLTEKILNLTSYRGFDIIGFSLHCYSEFLFALLLAEKIKKETNAIIVFGGAFITLYGKLFFEKYNFIDYMIVGDGGIPFLKLLDYLKGKIKIGEIPSLLYRENKVIKMNNRIDFKIEDTPLPDFIDLPLEIYREEFAGNLLLPYQISRGCSSKCNFCTFRLVDIKPDIKSAEKVITELKELSQRYNSKYFTMCDTTFNNFPKKIEEICDLLIQNKVNIKWEAFVRINGLEEKLISKMKKAGCCLMRVGVESGSNRMLQAMGKGYNSQQASEVLKIISKLNINNIVYIIIGYPYETYDDIKQTLKFIKDNKNYIQSISIYTFYLGYNSLIYNNLSSNGLENIRHLPDNSFAFDEIKGLKWEKRLVYTKKIKKQIFKEIYKELLSPIYKIGIIFYFFYWLEDIISILNRLLKLPYFQRLLDFIYYFDPRYKKGYSLIMGKDLFPFWKKEKLPVIYQWDKLRSFKNNS